MNTVISVRTDKDVKNAAQQIAQSIGISLSTMINAYLRQVIVTGRIELYAPEKMTPNLEDFISEVEAELKSGKVSDQFNNADDFLVDLKK
ncbi:MAG: type II toxin-antitoxin system RelB/DinJ family antitoxin [Candidatus Pacebacteria bacterium]|nr:type II toxin-antitoxin system RelB/DinJ family antitoxin [Candidatus Paceibacterota bacterium]NCS86613.1 type II toxin-antitoxin system RelB/DinJ family antitoxin [Candidatus Paceibacterota bacterium]